MAEPQDSFSHAGLKVQWAYKHINDLSHFSQGFISAKPYSVRAERNDKGVVVIKTGISPGIPAQIPLFAGDIVHALRSSLDYCWMGLERAAKGPTAAKKTFPYADERKGLISPVSKASIRWSLPQIERLILDEVKPYKAGNNHLWALNKLDNTDKHNLLVMSLGKLLVSKLTATSSDGASICIESATLIVGQEINMAAVGGPGADIKLDYEVTAPVEVVIKELGVIEDEPMLPTLLNMAQAVRETVKLFSETFS